MRDSRTAAAASMLGERHPAPAPVRASTTPSGSTIFALPRKRSGPSVPVWLEETQTTWFSTARARVDDVEVARLAVLRDAPRGPLAADRPGRHRGDDVGAVEGQRARRLGEELVVADEHPDPADRRVERREAVAGGVGEALAGRQMDLAVMAEHAAAVDADRRGVAAAFRAGLGVARADDGVAGHRDSAAISGPSGSSATGSSGPLSPGIGSRR